ncbi:MAG: Wzz/FepE/Etk N-terminal domain-containing protein [Eubacteriales bacterium]|nr:Wzz/FepE/Etk N-terminal domain-containing protein [Eubacteriales bacterium]
MEELNQKTGDDEIEIDLMEIFYALKKKIAIIILACILGGGIGFGISNYLIVPQYSSQSMIFVMTKETTITSLTDLQIGSQLTKDYAVLIKSRTVMEKVIENLGLNMSYRALSNKITVENPSATRIIEISVTDPDPQMAKMITDEVANCASNYISEIMEQAPPKIIEYGNLPLGPISPNIPKYIVLGAFLGGIIVSLWIVVSVLLNDTIMSEEDITKLTGVPVLAAIPTTDAAYKKNAGRGRGKSK